MHSKLLQFAIIETECKSGTTGKGLVYLANISIYNVSLSQGQGYDERKYYNGSLNLNFESNRSGKWLTNNDVNVDSVIYNYRYLDRYINTLKMIIKIKNRIELN